MIVIYAIIGLELFKGKLHATCYKLGTQKYSNFSDIYGPDVPMILIDPGDISVDDSGKQIFYFQSVDSESQFVPESIFDTIFC